MYRIDHTAITATIVALALTAAVAGCQPKPVEVPGDTGTAPPPAQPAEATPAAVATIPVTTDATPERAVTVAFRVYFDYQEKVQPVYRAVPYTRGVIKAAVIELIKGPTAAEKAKGLSCQIPRNTKVRGVALKNGVATIDLSGAFDDGGGTFSETMRLAELVYTATQFKGVTGVVLKMNGEVVDVFSGEGIELGPEPLTRAAYEDQTPAILVEMPSWGATLREPAKISGTSNVFEAQHIVQLIGPKGQVVAERPVTATSGTGTRGTWSARLPYSIPASGWGKVKVFAESAQDGSETDVVVIPVYLVR